MSLVLTVISQWRQNKVQLSQVATESCIACPCDVGQVLNSNSNLRPIQIQTKYSEFSCTQTDMLVTTFQPGLICKYIYIHVYICICICACVHLHVFFLHHAEPPGDSFSAIPVAGEDSQVSVCPRNARRRSPWTTRQANQTTAQYLLVVPTLLTLSLCLPVYLSVSLSLSQSLSLSVSLALSLALSLFPPSITFFLCFYLLFS